LKYSSARVAEVSSPDAESGAVQVAAFVVRQASRTSELVFSSADLVAYASEFVTLEPGDLLLTGTPGGVGHGMRPPTYLAPGQVVRTVIGHIGELENRCVPEAP